MTATSAGNVTVDIPITLHVGHGIVTPCSPSDRVASQRLVRTEVAGDSGRQAPSPETMLGPGGDRVDLGPFCLRVDRLPDALTITAYACFSVDAEFSCEVEHAGGVSPVTIRWFLNGIQVPALDNVASFSRRCAVGLSVRTRVVVSDATGAAVERSHTFRCLG